MKPPRTHRITVALRMAGIAGQDKLNGIFEYLSEGHRWQLSIFRLAQEFTRQTVQTEIEHGTEGFIIGIPGTDEALAELAKLDIPTIVMNTTGGNIESRTRNIAFIQSDASDIGREAARELLRQGIYRSFGYAGYREDLDWSRDRGRAFRDELEKAGFIGRMFDLTHFPDQLEDHATLISWLRSLPKPCGILAACDDRAFELLDICREAGIRVPSEIGILGVNNDPILCENAEPRLSSVQPDFIREGYLAAEIMDKMLTNPKYQNQLQDRVVKVGIRQIVFRDSTHPQSPAGILVQKALAFIEKNALKGISVQDVARHLKISYSLLNLRFQELQHESVYECILSLRLAAVKKLLQTSDKRISAIAEECGWPNPTALKPLFRKRFGMSMRQWRDLHGKASAR